MRCPSSVEKLRLGDNLDKSAQYHIATIAVGEALTWFELKWLCRKEFDHLVLIEPFCHAARCIRLVDHRDNLECPEV